MGASIVSTPSRQGLAEAPLRTVNFTHIVAGDKHELAHLVAACETGGFFYMDLRDWQNGQVIRRLGHLNGVMKAWFELPVEEKEKAEALSDAQGYKPLGQQSGPVEKTRDGYESLRISRTQLLNREPLSNVVRDNIGEFTEFLQDCHFVTMTVLRALSDALVVDATERFERYHKNEDRSRSAFEFIHHPPKDPGHDGMGHNMHTDLGLLTLLFNQQPGLQVITPQTNEWQYVTPRYGVPVMNVGDTLMFASQDRLRSALHRVFPAGGVMQEHRYSTAYFLRPGENARFKAMNGDEVTAEEWLSRSSTRSLSTWKNSGRTRWPLEEWIRLWKQPSDNLQQRVLLT